MQSTPTTSAHTKFGIPDIGNIIFLIILSAFFVSFYFSSSFVQTGYPDWMIHAFRIKSLEEVGMSSWTHMWSNGMNIWKTYQFLPHFITLGVHDLLHIDIPKAMVITAVFQFFLLRVLLYTILRLLHFNRLTSLICTLLSFDIAQYWNGFGDYSILFAFTLFPIVIFLWTKYFNGKLSHVYPYIAGLCFYIHPMLGFSATALWALAILFSKRRIISVETFISFLILAGSSSFFWLPLLDFSTKTFSNPIFSSPAFLQIPLSRFDYFGLSIFIIICFILSLFTILKPLSKQYEWINILLLYSALYLALVFFGTHFTLPEFINKFQFTRGATLIGIAILFTVAPIFQNFFTVKSSILKGILFFFIILAIVDGLWFTSIYSPTPTKKFEDPLAIAIDKKIIQNFTTSRIWTPTIDTSSYFSPSTILLPYSYMAHLEPTPIPVRLSNMLLYAPTIGETSLSFITTLNSYFSVTGTRFIILPASSRLAKGLSEKGKETYKSLGTVTTSENEFIILQTPFKTKNAMIIAKGNEKEFSPYLPDPLKSYFDNQLELDKYIAKLSQKISDPKQLSLSIEYPTPESIAISIPTHSQNSQVFINESYDSGWDAYFNKQKVLISKAGPQFMSINLPNTTSGNLVLKHSWPWYFYWSWFLIILLPLEIIFVNLYKRYQKNI